VFLGPTLLGAVEFIEEAEPPFARAQRSASPETHLGVDLDQSDSRQ